MVVPCLALALVACGDRGPAGGVRPELHAVPDSVTPRYDAAERRVLVQALSAEGAANRRVAGAADARLEGAQPPGPATAAPVDAPSATAVAATPPRVSARPSAVSLNDDLVDTDNVVELARAVLADRQELERRIAVLAAAEAPAVPVVQRVAIIPFAPGAGALDARERERLARVIATTPPAPEWIVRAGGPLGPTRGEALVQQLVTLGVPADAIALIGTDRDVDVAEIVVRR